MSAGEGSARWRRVRDLDSALAAIDAGERRLVTPPGAGDGLGVGFWRAVRELARERRPDARFALALDARGAPGWALAALREGLDGVLLDPKDPRSARVRAIAHELGAIAIDWERGLVKDWTWSGVWPVAPTIFDERGALDFDGQGRALELMIDQGADGICILANFSEQFLLSDEERAMLSRFCLTRISGRVPVIVAISHYATRIAVARAREAKELGAAAVMAMPPYHGATMRGTSEQCFEQMRAIGEVGVPIMIQDAPLSGVELSVELLAAMAREIEMVKLFKIECAGAAAKIEALLAAGGDAIEGPFDGEEGVTLAADLDAGARGSMTSALIPDRIGPIVRAHLSGDRAAAMDGYARVLPAIQHENRQCGFRAAKFAMKAGGVIRSDFCRHPVAPLPERTGAALLELLAPLDPLIVRWGR